MEHWEASGNAGLVCMQHVKLVFSEVPSTLDEQWALVEQGQGTSVVWSPFTAQHCCVPESNLRPVLQHRLVVVL
jgi:hypothetical protein